MLCRVTTELNALRNKPNRLKKYIKSRKDIQKQARADAQMIEEWTTRSKIREEGAKEDKKASRFEK
jgi:hypothetical protein